MGAYRCPTMLPYPRLSLRPSISAFTRVLRRAVPGLTWRAKSRDPAFHRTSIIPSAGDYWVPARARPASGAGSLGRDDSHMRTRVSKLQVSKLHLRCLLEHLALLGADVEELLGREAERACQ